MLIFGCFYGWELCQKGHSTVRFNSEMVPSAKTVTHGFRLTALFYQRRTLLQGTLKKKRITIKMSREATPITFISHRLVTLLSYKRNLEILTSGGPVERSASPCAINACTVTRLQLMLHSGSISYKIKSEYNQGTINPISPLPCAMGSNCTHFCDTDQRYVYDRLCWTTIPPCTAFQPYGSPGGLARVVSGACGKFRSIRARIVPQLAIESGMDKVLFMGRWCKCLVVVC